MAERVYRGRRILHERGGEEAKGAGTRGRQARCKSKCVWAVGNHKRASFGSLTARKRERKAEREGERERYSFGLFIVSQ